MVELKLMIGLPASGKTTYAKQWVAEDPKHRERINWDDLRFARGLHLGKFNRIEEESMQKESFTLAENLLLHGLSVVVDNTNLNPKTRAKWKGVAQRATATYVEHSIDTSLEECIARDSERHGRKCVGRAVIERMALFAGLIKFPSRERYIIVDMDGTVADCAKRRQWISDGRKDWDKFEANVEEDEPIWPIIQLVQTLNAGMGDTDLGYQVLIVSGRHVDKTGKGTVKWLEKHNVPHKHIFMRQSGDNRKDDIIKQEILNKLPKNQIAYVLDDRNRVVDMWRRNGLTCLQCAPGDF